MARENINKTSPLWIFAPFCFLFYKSDLEFLGKHFFSLPTKLMATKCFCTAPFSLQSTEIQAAANLYPPMLCHYFFSVINTCMNYEDIDLLKITQHRQHIKLTMSYSL